MKIAWFSPLAPDHSEIANVTARLTGDLQAMHEVRFFTERAEGILEPARKRLYPSPLGQTPTELVRALNEVDVPVYNLGNNPAYFSRIWFLNQDKPGIIILHDLKLHHFYEGIYRMQLGDRAQYLASIWEYYGRTGHEAGVAYWKQKISIDFMAQHFPMTAWAVRNALALVVHTPFALETIRRLTRTPVEMIPLAYAPRTAGRPATLPADAWESGEGSGFTRRRRARLILFGFLNVNRRIVEFLTALAGMPERERFEVRLVGTVLNRADVEAAVDTLGLRDRVTLDGYVPAEILEAALAGADLAINLRYPSMGEASGSQLHLWDHALPSLTTYTEGYATLPPDTVFFVHPDREREDIQQHLRHFLARPDEFHHAGQRGRQWLLEHHRPAMYVAQIDQLLHRLDALRSRHTQLTLADRVGAAAAPWINLVPTSERERVYAAGISKLV